MERVIIILLAVGLVLADDATANTAVITEIITKNNSSENVNVQSYHESDSVPFVGILEKILFLKEKLSSKFPARDNNVVKPSIGDSAILSVINDPDPIGSSQQIEELKIELQELHDKMKKLHEDHTDQLNKTNEQILLYRKVADLEKSIDNMNKNMVENELLDKMKGEVRELLAMVSTLTRRFLSDDCIRDIEAKRFKEAAQKLEKIANEAEIACVVHKIYVGRASNYQLLKNLFVNINNPTTRWIAYTAFAEELTHFKTRDLTTETDFYTSVNAYSQSRPTADDPNIRILKDFVLDSLKARFNGGI